jgi:hypothetical protein
VSNCCIGPFASQIELTSANWISFNRS